MEPVFAQSASKLDRQGLDKKIFIGQAYPSGNVYLECFRSKTECQSSWPKELVILPLGDTSSALGKTRMKASFVKVMKDDLKNDGVRSIYIPGAEGMDADHESCGLGDIKKVEHHKYISEPLRDYFYAMVDHCEANAGVGIYQTAASTYSFAVLGIDPSIAVTGLRLLSGQRPVTPAERQEIDKEKRQRKAAGIECSTDPAYSDSATQIAEISLAEGDLALKVSTYETPGCDGHLSSVYILDVLQRDVLLRKLEVYRNQGAL